MTTKIEWADETINPLIGCGRQCPYCYAGRMATRLAKMPHTAERYAGIAEGGRWTGQIRFVPSELGKLNRWQIPKRVFIGSMGDLCYATAPQISQILEVIRRKRGHTCIILTKDPGALADKLAFVTGEISPGLPPNLWVGASIENQRAADLILGDLIRIRASTLFVSIEPMHGPVDLGEWIGVEWMHSAGPPTTPHPSGDGRSGFWTNYGLGLVPTDPHPPLDWVIAGAETGPGAKPANPDWFRSIRDQCAAAGVPFFFKRDSDGSRELDGVRHEEIPGCQ